MNQGTALKRTGSEKQDIYIYKSHELGTDIFVLDASSLAGNMEYYSSRIPLERYNKMSKYINLMDKLLLIGNEILFEHGIALLRPEYKQKKIIRKVDENGKPYIENDRSIYFNMSHAGKYSVCAFSDKPVGVDIEAIKPIDLGIAEKYYCKEEYADIIEKPVNKQLSRFYEYWVLKESFTKAVGLGLAIPLDSCRFSEKGSSNLLSVEQRVDCHKYVSKHINFTDHTYRMAVCIQAS